MDEIISLKMKGIDGMRHLCYEIDSPLCHLYILSPEIVSPEMGIDGLFLCSSACIRMKTMSPTRTRWWHLITIVVYT